VIVRWKSSLRRVWRMTCVAALAFVVGSSGSLAAAQKAPAGKPTKKAAEKADDEQKPDGLPIAIINAASADRLLGDVERVFKSAGKPEIYDLLKGFLGNFNDLKGMDRGKPFGLMVFLEVGVPPAATPVGYVPVSNIGDLVKSLTNGPFTTKKVEGKANVYEIVGPRRSIFLATKRGYAFISDKQEVLDRKFPDPSKVVKSISSRYDLAAMVNMNSVAQESRVLFATLLRVSAEAEIQQRDGEPKPAYEARRARSLRDLEWIEAFLLDCENVLIGLDASAKNKRLVVEASVNARKKSKMAKMLRAIGGKQSYFDKLLDEKAPLSVSVSWGLNTYDRQLVRKGLEFVAASVDRALEPSKLLKPEAVKPPRNDPDKTPAKKDADVRKKKELRFREETPVARVVQPLIAAAEKGHADVFFQFVGQPPEKFSLLAAVQLENGRQMAGGLKDLLNQIKQRVKDSENAPEIAVNAKTHRGIAFHRIRFTNVPGRMKRFFGETPSLYVGATSKAAWLALGGDSAFGELRKAVDTVVFAPKKVRGKPKTAAPFRFALNVGSWLAMAGDENGRPRPVRDLARKAFEKGGDGVRLEVRTTENGLRLRAQLDEGFLRFFGLGIARAYERRQANVP